MKNQQMIVFFLVVLVIYTLINLYLFFKGYSAFPSLRNNTLVYSITFSLVAAVFIIARVIEARHSSLITDVLNITGGFWLAFMLYGFLFFILSDIILLALKLTGTLGAESVPAFRKWSFFITAGLSFLLIAGGFINAVMPVIKEYNITINKPAGGIRSLKIAAVSDIHLGSIIRKRSVIKLSSMLKEMEPDMVLLLGDIIDGEIGPVLRGDLLQYFTCPKCENGLYAITGNHEYIGGGNKTIPYIESKGIRVLKDEIITLDGGIQLVGRIDRDAFRFYGKQRLPLNELMKQADTSKPVILLDHQPFHLDESVKNGVDLQLSGHTHNGQMWPLNYITRMIYEVSYGYQKRGDTHIIVSSGYGLWGPRVRSGSNSEVLLINITFSDELK